MRKIIALLCLLSLPALADNPGVITKGAVTVGHTAAFVNRNTIQDGGAFASSVSNADGTLTVSPTTGAVVASRPAITGDITIAGGSNASVLATVNSNVGTFGSASQVGQFTVNAKGLITAASNVTVTPAWSSITGTPTTLSGYGITSPLPVAQGGTATATSFTAGSVVYAGASGVYSQDNANFFWDGTNHRLGIGTVTPTAPLHVEGQTYLNNSSFPTAGMVGIGTSATANQIASVYWNGNATGNANIAGLYSNVIDTPTSASTSNITGLSNHVTWGGTQNSPSGLIEAMSNDSVYSGSGTFGTNYGGFFTASNVGGGTASTEYGVLVQASTGNSSTTTTSGGLSAANSCTSSTCTTMYSIITQNSCISCTVTDMYGLRVSNAIKAGGTITNDYGIFISNQTRGTNNWTLYSNGGNNYFGGSVGIGSTVPQTSLDLTGKTDAIILPAGTTGQRPTGVNGEIRYNSTMLAIEGYVNGIWQTLLSGSAGTPTCGAGCSSITSGSTDARGSATSGTLATSVVISFSATLPSAPFCTAVGSNTAGVLGCTSSTTALTCGLSTALTGDVITWICAQ